MNRKKVKAAEMISKTQWTMLKKVWISKLLKDHPKVIYFYNESRYVGEFVLELKVSQFRKIFLVSSILPKNERKQFDLRYDSILLKFSLVFGRFEDTKLSFQNQVTFTALFWFISLY